MSTISGGDGDLCCGWSFSLPGMYHGRLQYHCPRHMGAGSEPVAPREPNEESGKTN